MDWNLFWISVLMIGSGGLNLKDALTLEPPIPMPNFVGHFITRLVIGGLSIGLGVNILYELL